MAKYKSSPVLRKWIASKSIVVIGYCDDVKAVNLSSLLASWVDFGKEFSDVFPHAADWFQVEIVEKDDPRNQQSGVLCRVLEDFRSCPHIKAWSEGEIVDEQEVREMLAAMSWATIREEV